MILMARHWSFRTGTRKTKFLVECQNADAAIVRGTSAMVHDRTSAGVQRSPSPSFFFLSSPYSVYPHCRVANRTLAWLTSLSFFFFAFSLSIQQWGAGTGRRRG